MPQKPHGGRAVACSTAPSAMPYSGMRRAPVGNGAHRRHDFELLEGFRRGREHSPVDSIRLDGKGQEPARERPFLDVEKDVRPIFNSFRRCAHGGLPPTLRFHRQGIRCGKEGRPELMRLPSIDLRPAAIAFGHESSLAASRS